MYLKNFMSIVVKIKPSYICMGLCHMELLYLCIIYFQMLLVIFQDVKIWLLGLILTLDYAMNMQWNCRYNHASPVDGS